MNKQELHPELRKTFGRIPAIPFHNPVFYFFVNLLQRFLPRRPKPIAGLTIEKKTLSHCTVLIYRPQNKASRAGLLWIHGGGYIIGDAILDRSECINAVQTLGLAVVSVDYRLAPKHPFPAALDDCFEAWQLMQSSADAWAIDRNKIAVAGQSAGGGLAAALVQRIADAGGVQPAAQLLSYPMLDDCTAANTQLDSIKHFLWNNRNNRGAWGWYLNQAPGAEYLPAYAAAARRENLSGLPPAWIGVGELDLFFQEDCAYAERLRKAGVPCELHISPQAPHAFDIIAAQSYVSKSFVDSFYTFLREKL